MYIVHIRMFGMTKSVVELAHAREAMNICCSQDKNAAAQVFLKSGRVWVCRLAKSQCVRPSA